VRRAIGAVIVLLAAALPLPAAGQDTAAAEAAFVRGEHAFAEDDFAAALLAFEEAQRLAPHDVVRFNIALCLGRLGRYRESQALFVELASSTQIEAAKREEAAAQAAEMSTRLGTLVVEGEAGAEYEIVGVERCHAPCRYDLDPGAYVVRPTSADDEPQTVQVQRGTTATARFGEPPTEGEGEGEGVVGGEGEGQGRGRGTGDGQQRHRRGDGGFRLRIGTVGWIGAGVAAVGLAGTLILGLRAEALHDSYEEDPTRDRLDDGRTAVVLTNVSLGLAVVGAAIFALDVLVLERRHAPSEAPGRVALSF